jgi:O-methyltransferase
MHKINFRGLYKGLFFFLRIDLFIPSKILLHLSHTSMLSKWIRKNSHHNFNDFYTPTLFYGKRYELFEYVIGQYIKDAPIDYFEFGVSKGSSFRWWVNNLKNTETRFYGFDTFTGLPEAWGPYKKGDMGNGNEPPKIEDNRHVFYQGLFQQTLIGFLSTYKAGKPKVIHMDADIYSSTLYVLTLLTPFLQKGDILLFDEFNVPMHEFKAFTEWTNSFYIDYEVIGSVNNYYQTAILLK